MQNAHQLCLTALSKVRLLEVVNANLASIAHKEQVERHQLLGGLRRLAEKNDAIF